MQRRRLRAGRRRVPESGASSDYDSVWVSDVVPRPPSEDGRVQDVSRAKVQRDETKGVQPSRDRQEIKRGVKTDAQTPKLKSSAILVVNTTKATLYSDRIFR